MEWMSCLKYLFHIYVSPKMIPKATRTSAVRMHHLKNTPSHVDHRWEERLFSATYLNGQNVAVRPKPLGKRSTEIKVLCALSTSVVSRSFISPLLIFLSLNHFQDGDVRVRQQ